MPDSRAQALSPQQREAEEAWIAQLGLRVPHDGLLLSEPYRRPFCRRSLVVPHEWYKGAATKSVSADSLRADLPLLAEVMRMAYFGWEALDGAGFWDTFFSTWDRDLARYADRVAPAPAFHHWIELQQVKRDHHSGPLISGFHWQSFAFVAALPAGTRTVTALSNGRETWNLSVEDPASQPWPALRAAKDFTGLEKASLIAYPSNRGPAVKALSEFGWVDTDPVELGSPVESIRLLIGDNDEPAYRQISQGIGYLRIPTLSAANGERLAQYKAWIPKGADGNRAWVVDVRGNGGGAASPALALIGQLIGKAALERGLQARLSLKRSCISSALEWGHAQAELAGASDPLSRDSRTRLQSILDDISLNDSGCGIAFEHRTGSSSYAQRNCRGVPRIVVLTDSGCGSDGEFLVYVLAQSGEAVVVGTNTAGCAQYIRPGYFVLPESRILFRLATGMSDLYGDGRSFDGYGLQVDVALPRHRSLDAESLIRLLSLLGLDV